jgi:hypothetical protein
MYVQSEVNASHIACRGSLLVARDPIFGGVVSANGGISCTILGHPSGTPTIVEAGDGIVCRSIFASATLQIQANRKRVSEVRAKIAPLLKIMKHLTAQQRERATELLYEADEMEAATEKLINDSHDQLRTLVDTACAEILVTELLYPGVKVRFPGVEAIINTTFKGPFTLTLRKGQGPSDIVLIDGTDKSCTVLASHLLDLAEAERSIHLAEMKAA